MSSKNPSGDDVNFVLSELSPPVAEVLSVFDTDGDGNVCGREIREGAALLRETKKENKNLKMGMAVGAVATVVAVGSLSGILHVQLQKNKDTEIQPRTGNLMVKPTSDANAAIEVSTKSHGVSVIGWEAISENDTLTCVSSGDLKDLFESSAFGTPTQYIMEGTSGLDIVSLGSSASWNADNVSIGEHTFVPMAECNDPNHHADDHRELLSDAFDPIDAHNQHKEDVFRRIRDRASRERGSSFGAAPPFRSSIPKSDDGHRKLCNLAACRPAVYTGQGFTGYASSLASDGSGGEIRHKSF